MKLTLLLLSFCLIGTAGFAQQSQTESSRVEIPAILLPYSNPLTETRDETEVGAEAVVSTEVNGEILRRISNAYRRHVLAIDAQVQGDLVQAENYINEAFGSHSVADGRLP
jgi:membrane-bound lytic murein transglycosylase D